MRVAPGNGNFTVSLDNANQGFVRADQGVVVDAGLAVGLAIGGMAYRAAPGMLPSLSIRQSALAGPIWSPCNTYISGVSTGCGTWGWNCASFRPSNSPCVCACCA